MDLAQEANQVRVITQALTDQGLDPEDVTTEVERLKNYGDLESVAGKHHKVLIKKEAVKLQQLEQEKLGSEFRFSGFLARKNRNSRSLTFHLTAIVNIE